MFMRDSIHSNQLNIYKFRMYYDLVGESNINRNFSFFNLLVQDTEQKITCYFFILSIDFNEIGMRFEVF